MLSTAPQLKLFKDQVNNRRLPVKPDDFRRRARQYRLAASLTDVRREAVLFNDLAMMFELIAHHFDAVPSLIEE